MTMPNKCAAGNSRCPCQFRLIYEICLSSFHSTSRSAAVPELWTLGALAIAMSDHPKIRSAVVGIATVLLFLFWMMTMMHCCDLMSLWIEIPMGLCYLLILPNVIRQASSLGRVILRAVIVVILAFGLVLGYLSWLHSDYFPRWLLFPRPRIHHRAPNTSLEPTPVGRLSSAFAVDIFHPAWLSSGR